MISDKLKIVLTALVLMLISTAAVEAQDEPTYRREIGGGIGLTAYQGDFNGSIMANMQPEATIVFRHIYTPYSALKIDFSFAHIKGSTDDVTTYYPSGTDPSTSDPNTALAYSFKRSLFDLNGTYEYNFLPYGTGRDYRGAKRFTPFFFFGLGFTYASGNGEDNAFTANVPIGLGVKYKIGQRLNFTAEWAFHPSLSDKLDGIKDPYGIESSGIFKNTDSYTSLRLTLTYSFSPKCPTCNKDDW